jgi:succinyl-diaminopimelate desuccinylase
MKEYPGLLSLAQEMIRYPTVTPEDNGLLARIGEILQGMGFQVFLLPFGKIRNLYARFGSGAPLLCLAGHTDVVPVGDPARWAADPFCGDIVDGRLYGRGATDMKGAVAAQIMAARSFLKNHPDFSGSIGFLLTGDEEAVAEDGTVRVLDWLRDRGEKIDFALVGEPTGVERVGDTIKNGRRGSINGELILYGVQGHAAYPHLAENPIHRGLPVLQEMVETCFDRGNAFFPPTHFGFTSVQAGAGAANVIPGEMKVSFNLRYSSASTFDSIRKTLQEILNRSGLRHDLRLTHFSGAFITPPGKLTDRAAEAVLETAGIPAALSTSGGTSDARFFAAHGVEVAELGLVNRNAHKVDESVPVEEIHLLCRIYERTLEKMLHI